MGPIKLPAQTYTGAVKYQTVHEIAAVVDDGSVTAAKIGGGQRPQQAERLGRRLLRSTTVLGEV